MADKKKLAKAIEELGKALGYEEKARTDAFYSAGLAKSFEICFEYAWKFLKYHAVEQGLEVYSPRDAIKAAGRLGVIGDVEAWLGYLEDRNLSVHDYLGVDDDNYIQTIKNFYKSALKLIG